MLSDHPGSLTIDIQLSARGVIRTLLSILAALLGLHLFGAFAHVFLGWKMEAYTVLFDMDLESNLPTYFNSMLFFLAAMLMYVKGRGREGRLRRGWYTVAAVCAFLGVDEGSQIHEKFMLFTLRLINHGEVNGSFGWLYYAWVIPYGLAALLLGLILSRWFLALEARIRNGLIASGALYVFGAVFMEMLSGKIAEHLDPAAIPADRLAHLPCEIYETGTCHLYMDPGYIAVYTVEETCEMAALILCIYVILKSLERRAARVEVDVAPKG
jgi:hypothetical protein